MTVADDLEAARAALVMINPAPYNAEAPPAALVGEVTPTELHYVRSNFAVPDHDGTLEIGGAVGAPTTLTLDDLRAMPAHDHTVTLECAGNGRLEMRPLPTGEPWGDFAVSTARWTGRSAARGPGEGRARGRRSRAPRPGRRPRPLPPPGDPARDRPGQPHLHPLPARSTQATDPASGILIAYEMNGQPLGRDHGAPFRLIVPHWYAVASVKWLNASTSSPSRYTGEFQTGHYIYEWPDRPHEPVSLMRVRARITDPAPGSVIDAGHLHRPREGLVRAPARSPAWTSASPERATGSPRSSSRPGASYQWQDWSFTWDAIGVGRHTLRARATDAAGNVQPDVPPWNRLGYGNNAIEVIYVDRR